MKENNWSLECKTMPRTKKQVPIAAATIDIVAPPALAEPEPIPDLTPTTQNEEEEDSYADEDEEEDSYDDTFDDAGVPVLKALFDLLTNEEGTNVAQILTNLGQSIDKTNKILFKLLNVLSQGSKH